jgi:hypothetical protein
MGHHCYQACNGMKVDKYTVRRVLVLVPLIACLVWLSMWGVSKATEPPRYSCDRQGIFDKARTVDIEKGDTVYDIAHKHCSGDIGAVISIMVDMYGTDLDTWQTIHLPVTSPRS